MWRMPLAGESLPPLLIIVGATAIGKTGLGIEIAEALNGEIVGADSRQIYKYMDIGTAKPTETQQARVKHHLIDVVAPNEMLTLAAYQRQAYTTIDKMHKQAKLPILVGGTGQYITAVEEGWSIPEVPPNYELRDELEQEAETIGAEAFHAKLMTIDSEAAEKIHPNNIRRVVRALEVFYETGTPISDLQRKKAPPYRIRVIGLQMEREALYERADLRVDMMMAEGFLDEVQQLLADGYSPTLPAMTALGYREMSQHLADQLSLQDAIDQTKHSTHDFIRRQEIWFRGHDNGILWHNIDSINVQDIIADVSQWMQE